VDDQQARGDHAGGSGHHQAVDGESSHDSELMAPPRTCEFTRQGQPAAVLTKRCFGLTGQAIISPMRHLPSRKLGTLAPPGCRRRRCRSRRGGAANATPKRACRAAGNGQSEQRRRLARHALLWYESGRWDASATSEASAAGRLRERRIDGEMTRGRDAACRQSDRALRRRAEHECDPGVEFCLPAWATVRVGSKAEPRSGSECE
jgi:hypothetical protein